MDLFNSKRKLSSIKLTREFQIRYYGWWFLVSVILIGFLGVSLYFLFEEQWTNLLVQDPYRSLEYVYFRNRFVKQLIAISLVLLIFITILGIFTAHRVAGPLIALKNAFEKIQEGDYSYRIKFRKGDELSDLEGSFNEMMDQVQKDLQKE